jgi:methylated-DNA-[protein]-cysteine S-methyltransferase
MSPTMTAGWAVFETPLGWGGIAWTDRGLSGVQLPEADRVAMRSRLRRRFPGVAEAPPPPDVQCAIEAMADVLAGVPRDLSDVELDLRDVEPFEARVYAVARTIPFGETLSYGQIATRLGDPRQAREVGQALGRNPFPLVVPCHRVIGAGGKLGGFSARGGVNTKQRLLEIEKANVSWQLPLQA